MMNRRRLVAFFVFCSQFENPAEMPPEEIERWYFKFLNCKVPHLNLNNVGTKRMAEYLKRWGMEKEYSEAERLELE